MTGEKFSPARARAELGSTVVALVEPGEVSNRGRFAGKPSPFGSARVDISIDDDMPSNPSGNAIALPDAAAMHRKLVDLGATDAELSIDVGYRDQCNIAFSPATLRVLAELNLGVSLSCWEDAL